LRLKDAERQTRAWGRRQASAVANRNPDQKLEAVNYLPDTGWFKLDVNLVDWVLPCHPSSF